MIETLQPQHSAVISVAGKKQAIHTTANGIKSIKALTKQAGKTKAKPRPFVEPRTSFAPQEHQQPKVRGQANVLTNSERTARAQARQRNNRWWPKYAEPYTCPELQQNPGIPANRFAAYSLPSRSGDWLYYPDGRVLPFPGSAADRAATPPPNRTNPRSAP